MPMKTIMRGGLSPVRVIVSIDHIFLFNPVTAAGDVVGIPSTFSRRKSVTRSKESHDAHRHFLLLGLGLASLWLSWNGISEAQQRPNARILKFPTEATHSKFYVTIMGEVGHPGVYEFDHPNVTLPE